MTNLEKATSFETLAAEQMNAKIIQKNSEFFIQIIDHHNRKKIIAEIFGDDKKVLRNAKMLLSKNESKKWFDLVRMTSDRGHDWMICVDGLITAIIDSHECMLLCQKLVDAKMRN